MGRAPSVQQPTDSSTILVEEQIGQAYKNVKTVAENIDGINLIAANMSNLGDIADNLDETLAARLAAETAAANAAANAGQTANDLAAVSALKLATQTASNAALTAQAAAEAARAGAEAARDAAVAIVGGSYVATTQIGAAGGVCELDGAGFIPAGRLPAIAITKPNTVSSQAEMLALVAQEGDVAIRTDLSRTYIKNSGTTGTITDWTLLQTPTDVVTSVAGLTGVISAAGLRAALNAANLSGDTFTGHVVSTMNLVASGGVVARGGVTEGGQLILGYVGNTALTGEGNSTWNMDVDSSNTLRLFRITAAGAVLVAMSITESNGTVAFGPTVYVNGNKLILQHDDTAGYIRAEVGDLWLGTGGINYIRVTGGHLYNTWGDLILSGAGERHLTFTSTNSYIYGDPTASGAIGFFSNATAAHMRFDFATGNLTLNSQLVATQSYVSTNYLPKTGGVITGNLQAGDVTITRGDGTGVLYFATAGGTKYLYFDATIFYFTHGLTVNGVLRAQGNGCAITHSDSGYGSGKLTIASTDPTGGTDGDIWIKV